MTVSATARACAASGTARRVVAGRAERVPGDGARHGGFRARVPKTVARGIPRAGDPSRADRGAAAVAAGTTRGAAADGGGRARKMGSGVFRVSETGTRGEREARVRRGARRRRGDPRRETERVVIRARSMR